MGYFQFKTITGSVIKVVFLLPSLHVFQCSNLYLSLNLFSRNDILFYFIFRERIAESQDRCMFNFRKYCQTLFHSVYTNLGLQKPMRKFPLFHSLTRAVLSVIILKIITLPWSCTSPYELLNQFDFPEEVLQEF